MLNEFRTIVVALSVCLAFSSLPPLPEEGAFGGVTGAAEDKVALCLEDGYAASGTLVTLANA